MPGLLNDLRHALRALLRARGFATAALLALALGIGANTAVYSMLHTMVLTPLPFKDPERVMSLWGTVTANPGWTASLSWSRLRDWAARNRTFEALAGVDSVAMNLGGLETPQRVQVGAVTEGFFNVFQVRPVQGRTLLPSDPEGSPVVVLSEGLWRRVYGGDPALLGREVRLNGLSHTVVGILPGTFAFNGREAFVPLKPRQAEKERRNMNFLIAYGRLKAGVTLAQAREDLATVCQALATEQEGDRGRGALVRTYREDRYGSQGSVILLLGLAAGLVLLIACINVANQLLARATGRLRDMAVRAALGGGRLQVIAPSLAECLLISLVGAAAGLLVAHLALDLLRPLVPADLAQTRALGLHLPTLGLTLATALLTALLCGSAPGLLLLKLNLAQHLKEGSKSTESRGRRHLRNALVVAQVALALMLVSGFSAAYFSVNKLLAVPLGVRTEAVQAFSIQPSPSIHTDEASRLRAMRNVLEAVRSVPSVEQAGWIDYMPTLQSGRNATFKTRGREPLETDLAEVRAISPEALPVLGVPLVRGRAFEDADLVLNPKAVLINAGLADQYFPGRDPVGQEIGFGSDWFQVAGVVGDVRHSGPRRKGLLNTVYFPAVETFSPQSAWIVLRSRQQGEALLGPLRAAVRRVDPDLPVVRLQSLAEIAGRTVRGERVITLLLGLFAAIAALLALLGIHGSLSYSVAQRTQEIGIRMALGAPSGRVVRDVVREGLVLAGLGLLLGIAGAFAFSGALRSLVFEVNPTDPLLLAAASAVLLATAALACLFPALRASRVDPAVALRAE
ncbi:MAG: ABC transporter permease [Holophagaceae bacterium]|nr:ABC transporter permease [Holophagaceae bacterium]